MTVDCSSCGESLDVPDEYMGSTVTCPHCEGLVLVPEAPQQPPRNAASQSTPTVPASLTPSYFNVVNPAPATWVCGTCHRSFPPNQVYQLDGIVICHNCYAAVAAAEAAAAQEIADADDSGGVATHNADEAYAAGVEAPPAETDENVVVDATAAESSEVEETSEGQVDEGLVAVTESQTPLPLGARAESQDASWVLWTVAGSVGVIALATVLIISSGSSTSTGQARLNQSQAHSNQGNPALEAAEPLSEWDKKNASAVAGLRSQARLMLASKNLRGAAGAYQEMLNLGATASAGSMGSSTIAELEEARRELKLLRSQLPPDAFVSAQPANPGSDSTDSGPVITFIKPAKPSNSGENRGDNFSPDSTAAASTQPDNAHASAGGETTEKPSMSAPVIDEVNWEPSHRAQIVSLLAQADALSNQSKPLDALQKYQEVSLLIDQRRSHLKDGDLKSRLASADEARRKLLAGVRDTDEERLMSARALLLSALKAESAGKWNSALEASTDARKLIEKFVQGGFRFRDNDYLTTLSAQAAAYLQLQQYAKANEIFGDSEPLGRLASMIIPGSDPPRALVYNRALNDLVAKTSVMRSVKMLHDYMEKHKEVDEPVLNLLGTLLGVADENAPKDRKLLDAVIAFYQQRNIDLERTRPGQRRWGIAWMNEADVQQKFDEMNKAMTVWQDQMRVRDEAAAAVKKAEEDAKPAPGNRRSNTANPALTSAKSSLDEATRAVASARAAVPRVSWVTDLTPIVPTYDSTASVVSASAGAGPVARPVLVRDPNSDDLGRVITTTQPTATTGPAGAPIAQPPPIAPALIRVQRTALAFPVDRTRLLTAAEPLGDAKNVRLVDTNGTFIPAHVVAKNDRLALLEVAPADVPAPLRYFDVASGYPGGPVRCLAMPEANVFGPSVTYINADNIGVPKGATWTIGLADHPRLAGSPLVEAQNGLVGVVLGNRDDSRQRLPTAPLSELKNFLSANHALPASPSVGPESPMIYQVDVDRS